MNEFSKKELIGAIKNMKPKETNIVRQNGEIEVMAKGVEIETLLSKEITLKSIYELIIKNQEDNNERFNSIDALIIKNQEDNNERFNSIDALIIKNQKDNNERFDAIDNEIKIVKKDVKNLDTKVNNLDSKVTDLDNKLNKVIELNNLKF